MLDLRLHTIDFVNGVPVQFPCTDWIESVQVVALLSSARLLLMVCACEVVEIVTVVAPVALSR